MDYENAIKLIESLDYSHKYTTDKVHCLELYNLVCIHEPQCIVELGSYKGISTIALALAAPDRNIVSVDLCDEIPTSQRRKLWDQYGIENICTIEASATDYLNGRADPIDFLFHDAGHGDSQLTEYLKCWNKISDNGLFVMHDFDQITDKESFKHQLNARQFSVNGDSRGRQLAVFIK